MLEATPLGEFSYKEGNHHVATCPIQAGEQQMQDDFNPAEDNSEDWFPHKELPIFARNEMIRQEMSARERKRNIEEERDRLTWSQWDQQQA